MRLYGYGWIDRALSSLEVSQLVTYYAQASSSETITKLIDPAQEDDIELMVVPSQRVTKMTKQKYLNDFFERGILQLGTYDSFQNAGNIEVRDDQEGFVTLIGREVGRTAWGRFMGGADNYLFCTYLGDPDPSVIKAFEYEACYFINDPRGFAKAVQMALDAQNYSFGKCVYCEEKALIGELKPDHSFERIDHRTVEMIGEAMNFVKPMRYSHQLEFRFVWKMPAHVRGSLVIECPNAVQFCSIK